MLRLNEYSTTSVCAVFDNAVVLGVVTSRTQGLDADDTHKEESPPKVSPMDFNPGPPKKSSSPDEGPLVLNPSRDFIVRSDDQLCMIARDKTSKGLKVRNAPARPSTALSIPESRRQLRERKSNQELLICNWRDDMEDVSEYTESHALDDAMDCPICYQSTMTYFTTDYDVGERTWSLYAAHAFRYCTTWTSALVLGRSSPLFRT